VPKRGDGRITESELRKYRQGCPQKGCTGFASETVLSRAAWKYCLVCGHEWDHRDASSRPITGEQRDELVKPRAGSRSGGEAEERRAQGRRREQYKQEEVEMTKAKKGVAPKTGGRKKKLAAKRASKKTDGKRDPRIPKVGTTLKGKYKGKEYTAKVTAEGFEFDGKLYSSISKVGSSIMNGKACNGYKFFGLC